MNPAFPVKLLLFAFALVPLRAHAALGGTSASVQDDVASMKASLQVREANGYAVHEIQATTGTSIREYVSPAGTVFGVAWQGPFIPDLHQLLGAYFDQYSAAVKAQKSTYIGRRPLNIESPGLVIQTNGHMRGYAGRVYVPTLVPAGTKLEELW
jgi:uncharacterized protein DUF2844